MAREFSRRERNVIIAGGIIVVCFLTYSFALSPQREELRNLKGQVRSLSDEYDKIEKIEANYMRLKEEADPIVRKVLQRRKDFDLSTFVAETEKLQNFSRFRGNPPSTTAQGKQTCSFSYQDKTLYQIVEFLKQIEKSEHVVGIELLKITPKSASDPSRLNVDIRLVTVVPAKKGE